MTSYLLPLVNSYRKEPAKNSFTEAFFHSKIDPHWEALESFTFFHSKIDPHWEALESFTFFHSKIDPHWEALESFTFFHSKIDPHWEALESLKDEKNASVNEFLVGSFL